MPLTYVYSDPHSYEPLARIDGTQSSDIYWFHNQPNGTPERLTDVEGRVRWEGRNSAWGKLTHESTPLPTGYHQNLRMQGQYLDRETGLHYNLFRYYDPDCGRFTLRVLIEPKDKGAIKNATCGRLIDRVKSLTSRQRCKE